MFEIFDHTADIGIRARAAELETLFADAARGLSSLFAANLEDVQTVHQKNVRVHGEQRDFLLFDWLTELLFEFETAKIIYKEFDVSLDESGLSAVCYGEKIDPQRHHLEHEVKAITYHELKVVQCGGEWMAEVIVDI